MVSTMMKRLAFAFVVCSFVFTNVLSESTTTISSSETSPQDDVGTSVPPQNAAPQTSNPGSQSATGKQEQVTTIEAGTQSSSQMTKENISPGGTQADNKTTSTTGPQNKSPQTTQAPSGQSSTAKVEGQSTKANNNSTNFPSMLENATAVHNESAAGQHGVTDKNQNTTMSPAFTAAINSTAKQHQTTAQSTDAPVPKPGRSFDLVSFLGGILVALCFTLIVAFLYCCSKSGKGKPYENLE